MAKVKTVGKMLRWARETAHISLEKVASRLNKNPQIIKEWEEEKDFPTYPQLETLAYELYKRPLAIFFFPEPPEDPINYKSFRTLPEFEFDNLKTSVINIMRRAQIMFLNLNELSEGKNPSQKNILKETEIDKDVSIEHLSEEIRSIFKITLKRQVGWSSLDEAFKEWRSAFQDNGIFVFMDAFRQDDVSGFCLYNKEFPIIYINNSLPKTRQIFTLFHELGHLFKRTSDINKIDESYVKYLPEEEKEIESFCNKFASEFLVPESDFIKQLEEFEFSEDSISAIANHYWVSREVILRKIYDKKIIDKKTYEELVSKWIKQAIIGRERRKGGGGNYYLNKITYLGHEYIDMVFKQYYLNRIGIERVADYLDMKVDSISNLESEIVSRR